MQHFLIDNDTEQVKSTSQSGIRYITYIWDQTRKHVHIYALLVKTIQKSGLQAEGDRNLPTSHTPEFQPFKH